MEKVKIGAHKFLRWSEKYTKTDMVYLAKGGSWFALGSAVTMLSAFILGITFASLIPKEVYGTYKYIISLSGIFGAFALTGLGTAVTQSVARGFDGVLKKAFSVNLRWSFGIIASTIIGSLYYFLRGNMLLSLSILVIGAFLPFLNSANFYTGFLAGKKDFRRLNTFGMFRSFIPMVVLIATLLFTHDVLSIIIAYFAAHTFTTLLFYFFTTKKIPENATVDPHFFHYSKHLSIMNIIGATAGQLDNVLVYHFFGPAQLAIYYFATAIPDQLKGPLKGLNSLILPKFAERSSAEIHSSIKRKILLLFGAMSLVVMAYIAIAPLLYDLFFPQYSQSIAYSQIYALSFFGVAFSPIGIFFTAKKKIREQYWGNIITPIFKIGAMIICLFYWGIWGLIAARIIVQFFAGGLNLYLYRKSLVN
mgnify:CR=1 FL=1